MQALAKEEYVVAGATAEQEGALREQIRIMNPKVLPARVVFVPHWKYVDNARIFRLHVPTGSSSAMFTHLPSRTMFVDNDRYLGKEWLGHWIAHELGHLESNSLGEDDAEKVAHKLRALLKGAGRILESMDVGIDFVSNPVVFKEKSEERAGEKENPAAGEPGRSPIGTEEWNVHDIGGGVADVRHDGEENHRKKIFKMQGSAKVRPRECEPKDANGEKDEVVENAAGLPVARGGKEEFAEGRSGL